jgi:uncharacterized protein (DUF58 family)
MSVLPPQLLEQVRGLVALASQPVRGASAGHQRSRRLGGGSEFAEHREYVPGDDVRFLDWRALERTGRYLVKRYHTDRRCDVQLVLDRSGSMTFGTTRELPAAPWGPWPESKWKVAHVLALSLAQIFLRQGDRVGLCLVDGDGVSSLPPRGGQGRLSLLAASMLESEPQGRADLREALTSFASSQSKPLVVVLSDLLAEEDWLPTLQLHAARGSETWLLHVVDPAEVEFPFEEPTLFSCLEGGGEISLNPRELSTHYHEEFTAFLDRQRRGCLDAGINYQQVRCDEDLVRVLARFLAA